MDYLSSNIIDIDLKYPNVPYYFKKENEYSYWEVYKYSCDRTR